MYVLLFFLCLAVLNIDGPLSETLQHYGISGAGRNVLLFSLSQCAIFCSLYLSFQQCGADLKKRKGKCKEKGRIRRKIFKSHRERERKTDRFACRKKIMLFFFSSLLLS